jgi:hypothetical protein
LLGCCAVAALFTLEGFAQNRIEKTGGFDGPVNAISEPDAYGTRYIGGDFTAYGKWNTGGGAVVNGRDDLSDGSVNALFPRVNGKVYASVADGSGGFFIGGDFDSVDGTDRTNAAHIKGDGSLADWNPEPNKPVRAIGRLGEVIYLGGEFDQVGAADRSFAAAVTVDGTVVPTWKPEPNNTVRALAVADSKVYLGGDFTAMGSTPRNRLAAVSTAGTLDTTWNPNVDGKVRTISTDAAGTIYFGGDFTKVGSTTRNHAAAVGADGILKVWDPNVNGPVFCMGTDPLLNLGEPSPNPYIVIGGDFTKVGSELRSNLAKVSSNNEISSSFKPNPNGPLYTIAFENRTANGMVYVGGDFSKIAEVSRKNAAAMHFWGDISPWRPDPDGQVLSLSVEGRDKDKVYLGGTFSTLRGELRPYAAAVDINGALNSAWRPQFEGPGGVDAVLLSEDRVFLGGRFTGVKRTEVDVGLTPRQGVVAIALDGTPINDFKPVIKGGSVRSIATIGDRVFLAGSFNEIDTYPRKAIAALFRTTGYLDTEWDAQLQGTQVSALATSGSTLYLGGVFTQVRGTSRSNAAAITIQGDLTPWNPTVNGEVLALEIVDSTIYLGGNFSRVRGLPRGNAVAVDNSSGDVSDLWRPSFDQPVLTIRSSSSQIYLGGDFTEVTDVNESNSRDFIAAVSPEGLLTDWHPSLAGEVSTISISPSAIFAGGSFTEGGDSNSDYLALLDPVQGSPIPIPTSTQTPTPSPSPTPTSTPTQLPTSTPTQIVTATPTVQPTPQPAPVILKPEVTWSSNQTSHRVRAFVTRRPRVSYTISATSGGVARSGQCAFDSRTRKTLCTITLTKGTWLTAVTPHKQGVAGPATRKRFTFRR